MLNSWKQNSKEIFKLCLKSFKKFYSACWVRANRLDEFSKAFPFKETGELRMKSTGWAVANCDFIPSFTNRSNIAKTKLFVKMSTNKNKEKKFKKKKRESFFKVVNILRLSTRKIFKFDWRCKHRILIMKSEFLIACSMKLCYNFGQVSKTFLINFIEKSLQTTDLHIIFDRDFTSWS